MLSYAHDFNIFGGKNSDSIMLMRSVCISVFDRSFVIFSYLCSSSVLVWNIEILIVSLSHTYAAWILFFSSVTF